MKRNSYFQRLKEQSRNIGNSYYIMTEKLVEDRYLDYEKYIRTIDPSVPKSFLASVIDHIDVDDGRVVSITFQNGIKHSFTYKG